MPRTRFIITALLLALGCSDATDSGPVRSLVVTPNPITLATGDSVRLEVYPVDEEGNLVLGVPVAFESADSSVAVVSFIGTVIARHKGTTTIVVSSGEHVASVIPITVTAPIVAIFVRPADTTIAHGTTAQLRGGVVDADGDTITTGLQWTSSDTTIATVSATGLVRSVGPTGTAAILMRSGVFVAFANVTITDPSVLARLPLSGRPYGIAIHNNIAYITRLDLGRVQLLDLASRQFIDSIVVGQMPAEIAINAAGTRAYIANQQGGSVSIVDLATRSQIGTIPVSGEPIPVEIGPSDSTLFVSTNANKLYKVDLRTHTIVDSLGTPANSAHLLAHPNDTLLYVATREGGSVLEVNWRTMSVVRTFTLAGMPQELALAPDRSELYVGNESSNLVHFITLSDGNVANVPVPGAATDLTLNADGTKLYVGLLTAGRIQVFNRVARTLEKQILTGGTVRQMRVDTAGDRIVVSNESNWVDIVR